MLFVSYEFVAFLIIFIACYYTVFKRFQWQFLLVGSILFYLFAGKIYLIYMALVTAGVYFATLKTDDLYLKISEEKVKGTERSNASILQQSKIWLYFGLFFSLGTLIVVKYSDFAISNINFIFNEFTGNTPLKSLNIILPMGISFYTFKSISYLVDVYRKKYRAERNFFKFALYISFFPQLIQGPISRFDAMSKSLFIRHNYNHKNFIRGFYRLLWGYFKKMVVADRIMPAVLTIISDSETYNGAFAFLGIMFYAVQIYADFSGGIDITIAIAEMLGIKVEENFIRPYFSKNIKEYWRRWHITMGTWFRDYVFYPVSVSNPMLKLSKFSRKHFGKNIGKRVSVYISALTVWFLTGLWHGAGWNFVVWGLLNGICILISDELKDLYAVFHKFIPVKNLPFRLYDAFSALRTVLIMSSIRMLDCYQDVGTAFKAFFSIFRVNNWDRVLVTDLGINAADYAVIGIGVIVIFLTSMASRKIDIRDRILGKNEVLWYPLLALLFIIILIFGVYGIGYDSSQFIYNRF